MTNRNLACKSCGTKVFKSPEEADGHHKETHPEIESQEAAESSDQEDKDTE